ncbi:MAG: hypothetical protein QM737_22695 [Ferruginibacter sp.]
MRYYNRYGLHCTEDDKGEVLICGLIEVDGEEVFESIVVKKSEVNKVSNSTLMNEHLKRISTNKE